MTDYSLYVGQLVTHPQLLQRPEQPDGTWLIQSSLRDHCRQGALTTHLLLQPVFEYGHTGVDPRLPRFPTAIPPRGDSKEDLSGVWAWFGTG